MKIYAHLIVSLLLTTTQSCFGATYTYDFLNRLTAVDYGNGTSLAYTYDSAGNLLSMASNSTTATYPLSMVASGRGSGVVTSSPTGINCGTTCSANFAANVSVMLTATPASGSVFSGWSGACTGLGSCIVSMSAAKSVTANFSALPPTCTLAANPSSITAGGSSSLTASCTPAATSYAWTGGSCAGANAATCIVTPAATTTYTVTGSNSAGMGNTASATVMAPAIFAGNRAEYRISSSGSGYTVSDQISGRDGSRLVTSTDHLKFSDMTVNLTIQAKATSISATVLQRLQELYIAFFNRIPDADGLSFWIDQYKAGQSINQIAEAFYNLGVQYSSLTGFSSGMSNADFINTIYRNVLGRSSGADTGGLAYWNGELTSGRASRGSLVATILDAAHSYKGDPTYGSVADYLDNKVAVANRFAVILGLTYNSDTDSITKGVAIAAAVTATSTAAALALIGISDGLAAPAQAVANIMSYQLIGGAPQKAIPTTLASVITPPPAIAACVDSACYQANTSNVGPLSGLWWNPNEPGWGVGVIQHDRTNFVVVYSYDLAGQPTWYAMPNCPFNGMSCTGDIYRMAGGTPPIRPWNGSRISASPVGSGALTFVDTNSGSYSFTIDGVAGIKAISRRTFAAGAVVPTIDYTDLWVSPNEAGWGVTLIQQYGIIFAAIHTYDWSGQPTWYVASSCPVVGSGCTGELYQVMGGYPLTSPWYGTSRTIAVGTANFNFTDVSNGTMSYSINGVAGSKSITRQSFQ